jgi:hypothetical protein
MFWIALGVIVFAFLMGGAWCACCGCAIIQDDFTRSNSTDMGDDWTEESGDWQISTNRASTTDSNAILVHGTAITEDQFVVQIHLSSSSGSPSARIYVREDDDNYVCGEYQFQSGINLWILKIIERVGGGAESELMRVNGLPISSGAPYLRLYIDKINGAIVFTQYQSDLDTTPVIPSTSNRGAAIIYKSVAGTEIAIGTGTLTGGITAYLDQFRVHPKTVSCGEQIYCCTSQGDYPPEEIQVEIADLDGDFGGGTCVECEDFDGTYTLTLRGRYGVWSSVNLDGCVWAYQLPGTTCSVNWIAASESTDPTFPRFSVFLIRTGAASSNLSETTEISYQQFNNTDASKRMCNGNTIVANESGGGGTSGLLCKEGAFPDPSWTGVATATPL